MENKALTLTIVANMTANYGVSMNTIIPIQKIYKEGRAFAVRTKESLKSTILNISGLNDDVKITLNGSATQKIVSENINASNCRSLEAGYLNTAVGEKKLTYARKSSFYLTDAISTEPFNNVFKIQNNIDLAEKFAKQENLIWGEEGSQKGLKQFLMEFSKDLKIYSLTIDLTMVGKDKNFNAEASNEEKALRVNAILNAVENLTLVVRGSLDNAEPIFIVGGFSPYFTHKFENYVRIKDKKLLLNENAIEKLKTGKIGYNDGYWLENQDEIESKLSPITIGKFFAELKNEVNKYYGV